MKLHRTLFTAWVFAAGVALHAQNAHNMVVQTNKLGAEIQPTMYGLFFEDINYGADGGLYAELVKNRSFEFPQRFMGWNVFGNVTLMDDGPFERNPHYVRLGNSGHREKHTGIETPLGLLVRVRHVVAHLCRLTRDFTNFHKTSFF